MLIRKIGKIFTILLASSLFAGSAWHLTEHFQWREAFTALLGTDFLRLIGLVWIVQFAYIIIRTWRWWIVVRHAKTDVGFFDLYWITAVVVSLAILTPGSTRGDVENRITQATRFAWSSAGARCLRLGTDSGCIDHLGEWALSDCCSVAACRNVTPGCRPLRLL